ncbi:arylformamidase [Coemansia sp. RSA 1813]|nr:arylformamidase [Coemansia sp. RSA 1646]KAJ1771593.1 arylformamidase [Coemansia sp. RSA 1843]KAJ2089897.1 arylformamidase [Coemansia sp. RSA 986]KAJ2215213.1 arylformamidase [Coemansia sp. RSA 487]KAJ2571032.1 arylformamidase [Coemansia sp. RSA 1813]
MTTPPTDSKQHRRPRPSAQYASAELDVWTMMNQVSASVNAVNLGQGYMSFPPKDFIKTAAQQALVEDTHNQYAPPRGRPALLRQVALHFAKKFGRPIDSAAEVSVHAGANEALLSLFTAFLEHGKRHEVVLMEPAFDQYTPNIIMAGGIPVYVPLRISSARDPARQVVSSSDWTLDIAELEATITENTRILVLNTPHNPVGKVFSRSELTAIAAVAERHNLLVVSDEVYEHLAYAVPHVSIATLPGMWDRTVTVGSAGKLFGVTGWRVGWAIGPAELIHPTLAAHTRIVFTTNTPLQEGVASAFELARENNFFSIQRAEYQHRRDRLMAIFDDVGLPYVVPDGAYYLLVNASSIAIPDDYHFPDFIVERGHNFKLVYFFIKEFGVSGIPPTEFYSDPHKDLAKDYIRFAFCKTDEGLDEAEKRLQKLKTYLQHK